MEKWAAIELELHQRHEALLMRREAILRGTESYYDAQEARSAEFISDCSKAQERNSRLLQDLDQYQQDLRNELNNRGSPRFNTLKNNYWAMVKNVFPVWLEEQREYERRNRSPRARSPRSTGATPRSSRLSEEGHTPSNRSPRSARSPRVTYDSRLFDEESIPPLDLRFTLNEDGPTTTPRSRSSSRPFNPVPASIPTSGAQTFGSSPTQSILRSKSPDGANRATSDHSLSPRTPRNLSQKTDAQDRNSGRNKRLSRSKRDGMFLEDQEILKSLENVRKEQSLGSNVQEISTEVKKTTQVTNVSNRRVTYKEPVSKELEKKDGQKKGKKSSKGKSRKKIKNED